MLAFCRISALLIMLIFPMTELSRAAAASLPPLAAPPAGERWFSIAMDDEKKGFSCLTVEAVPDGYVFTGLGSVKMGGVFFSREAWSRERYVVHRDLSLISFDVEQEIGGKAMQVSGSSTGVGVRVVVTTPAGREEKLLKAKGAVYPPPVLNLYPLMRGVSPGKRYRLQMLDVEDVRIRAVTFTAVGVETLPGGVKTVHLRNDLFPVANDIWVDPAGNTVKESVRDDMIVTLAEDGKSAGMYLVEAALAGRDLVRRFALVTVLPPIARPRDLRGMVVELSGVPADVRLPEGRGQKVERLPDNGVRITTTTVSPQRKEETATPPGSGNPPFLESDERIPWDNPTLIAQKNAILGGEKNQSSAVEKLARWVELQAGERGSDAGSPLGAASLGAASLRDGSSQSLARLYTALARAAGIPTRVVAGLVYREGEGFQYQCWAESLVGEWMPVDPAAGEVPADSSHIKVVEGDAPDDLLPLARLIGRIRARVKDLMY